MLLVVLARKLEGCAHLVYLLGRASVAISPVHKLPHFIVTPSNRPGPFFLPSDKQTLVNISTNGQIETINMPNNRDTILNNSETFLNDFDAILNPLNPNCAEKIVSACYTHRFCVSTKNGTRGGGWCDPICTWWLLSLAVKAPWLVPGGPTLASCMDRLKKHYSQLVGGLFLAGKAVLALSTCLTNESADYCLLVNEWT